jgi:N-acetylglucosamine-6-phosphate deacetylase
VLVKRSLMQFPLCSLNLERMLTMIDLERIASADRFAIRGELVIGSSLVPGAVVIEGERIEAIVHSPRNGELPEPTFDAEIIAPGLIDLQVNGGFGVEVGSEPATLRHLADCLPTTGVTAFLPTVITSPATSYDETFTAFTASADAQGARPLGLHLEGPFLSPVRAGAHRQDLIAAADDALFDQLLASTALRAMTLASERPGAAARIQRLLERGVLVSLGHTDASYEEVIAAIDRGATMMTHLYNAMSPFEHRAPGAVGAALLDERVAVGLIADGVHSHPASLQLAFRAKGSTGIALVTDMMAAAGMPPGSYELGGRPVTVDATSARLADGTLAGAVITMDEAIRNMVRWTDAAPAQAIAMASETPARLLGLKDRGRLSSGYRADLVLFDRSLQIQATIIAGQIYDPASHN